mmetsp:Transcript_43669/g.98343  ORF Transcript_43669/g.98343 Transcript_43669/m.98343 type:complete len:668 (+) Transcript_43669:102-2105(+)
MANVVVQVKVHYEDEIRELPMAEHDMKSHPSIAEMYVLQAAQEITGMANGIRVTYADDEGDRCTFCSTSVSDALSFCDINGDASSSTGPVLKMLDLEVHTARASPKGEAKQQSMAAAPAAAVPVVEPEEQKILVVLLDEETGAQLLPLHISKDEWQKDSQLAHAKIVSHLDNTLGGKTVKRIAYTDDEGDKCSLVPASLQDALSFASASDDESTQVMTLHIAVEQSKCSSEPTCTSDASRVLEVLSAITQGVDIRTLLPMAAGKLLELVQDMQAEELFPLLSILHDFQSGKSGFDQLQAAIIQEMPKVLSLPPHVRKEFASGAKEIVTKLTEDLLKKEPSLVEVHLHVECDGCHMYPIIGTRHKATTEKDYDLCHNCYLRREEVHPGHSWVQVAGAAQAEVVGFENSSEQVTCDGCGLCPVAPADRFKCNICDDYDLCGRCHQKRHEIHPDHDNWRMPHAAAAPQAWATGEIICGNLPVVTCDGCGLRPLSANDRFKCQSCDDYDLCGRCHTRRHEIHPEHNEWSVPPAQEVEEEQGMAPSDGSLTPAEEMVEVEEPVPVAPKEVDEPIADLPLPTVNGSQMVPACRADLSVFAMEMLLDHPNEVVRAAARMAWLQQFTAEADPRGVGVPLADEVEEVSAEGDVTQAPSDDTTSLASDDEWEKVEVM